VQNQGSTVGGDDRHFVFRQKLLGEDVNMRRGVVMVKQPSLFSPKSGAMSPHVFTQSPKKKRRSRIRNSKFGLLGKILCAPTTAV
jgi:hypothetical protein